MGKIKINIKLRHAFSSADLSAERWHLVDTLSLTKELLKHNLTVKGTKLDLVNQVRTKILGLSPLIVKKKLITKRKTLFDYKQTIYKFMVNSALMLLGQTNHLADCCNEDDIVTTCILSEIPKIFLHVLHEEDRWYGFDIRSLYQMKQRSKSGSEYLNPFTLNPIREQEQERIALKCKILENLGFVLDSIHSETGLTDAQKFELYTLDVVQKLHHLDYDIDSNWILDLELSELKQLYAQVADVWAYRMETTSEQKHKIVKNGVVFAERGIQNITDRNLLLTKIIKNLDRMISEGQSHEDRKLGALYFMLGLVLVSDHAASAFHHLYIVSAENLVDLY